jgi:replicative DNA helicase
VTSATAHAQTLLSAIIPNRRDLLDKALRHLTPEHFLDQTLRNIFVMLERYSEVTGAIMTRAALGDLLGNARADAGKIALYQETYDLLHDNDVDESAFRWSLEQIRELAAERATAVALTGAMEILTKGQESHKGELLRGHTEARHHVLAKFAEIDRDLSMQDAPEGDMRTEGDDILADYAEREAARVSGRSVGIEFGIPALDAKIGGLQNGELVLLAGATNEGKTSCAVQLGWNAAIGQGRNVVILTTETLRNQVRRRAIARHSRLSHFGIDGGLNSRDIKNGTLTAEQKDQLRAVVADFTRNPGYGRFYIVQVPRAATIGYIESKLIRIHRMFHVDLVIMDYLALLKPEKRRNTDREELGNILKEAKQLATTFNDGIGVPFVSPWQVSRTARQDAERTGYYTPSALSETAEASNSSDLIVSLLAPLDNDARIANLKMQIMKNRDGEKANSIEVQVDYATSFFGTVGTARAETMDDLFGGSLLGV